MWPFTWLKNKLSNRSIEDIVNSELKKGKIEYDRKIWSRFCGTKSAVLGFAMYQKFSENLFGIDEELTEDISTFLKSFYGFLEDTKDSIPQDDFLRFACMSYIAWQNIVYLKSTPIKDDEEESDDRYGEPQGKYLKINWKGEDTEIAQQIKSRITPDMKLESIGLDFSGMILVESELNKKGYPVYLSSRTLDSCYKKDVRYLLRTCYFCLEAR